MRLAAVPTEHLQYTANTADIYMIFRLGYCSEMQLMQH